MLKDYARRTGCRWVRDLDDDALKHLARSLSLPLAIKDFCQDTRTVRTRRELTRRVSAYAGAPKDRYVADIGRSSESDHAYLLFATHLATGAMSTRQLARLFEATMRRTWSRAEARFERWITWSPVGTCEFAHPTIEEAATDFFEAPGNIPALVPALIRRWRSDSGKYQALAAGIVLPRVAAALGQEGRRLLTMASRTSQGEGGVAFAQSLGASIATANAQTRRRPLIRALGRLLRSGSEGVRVAAAAAIFDNAEACGRELEAKARALLAADPPNEACSTSSALQLVWAIAANFMSVASATRQLLYRFGRDGNVAIKRGVAEAIADNIEDMAGPQHRRYRLLLRSVARDQDRNPDLLRSIISAVEANFSELDDANRAILLELAQSQDFQVIEWVVWAIGNRFEDLDARFWRQLQRFGRHSDPRVKKWVAEALGSNVDLLVREHRHYATYLQLLRALAEDRNARVATAAASYLESRPETARLFAH
jgi:hypothetical protein